MKLWRPGGGNAESDMGEAVGGEQALYGIALTLIRGLGPAGTSRLINAFGSAKAVFGVPADELAEFGLREDLYRAISERKTLGEAEKELGRARNSGISVIESTSRFYPPLLKECDDYPAVIYAMGDLSVLGGRMLSMVGTRRVTQYGLRMCDSLIDGLSRRVSDLCIVSGLAFGVDAASHRAALRYGLPTVGIVPSPLPEITPAQNTDLARSIVDAGGAVLSELNSQTHRNANLYIPRNRLIAGMSLGCVIVESAYDGGAMHTAGFADGYNRAVMAVPGRATDSLSFGPNMLIRSQKARMVCSADDIIRELSWDLLPDAAPAPAREKVEISDAWRGILGCFRNETHLCGDELCELCAMSSAELAPLLLEMEFAGLIRALPGNIYEKLC